MLNKCPKCHHENPDDTIYCGKCATVLKPPEEIDITETIEAPKEELTTGSTFAGRYQIIEELGKGGMGRVYRVLDKDLNEEVALKLIKPEIAKDKKTIERFKNELKVARKISHRNVGRMYELMEDKGTHFITMEYISGQDLRGLIRQTGRLTIGKAISIGKEICEGLSEAHRQGVVHRDLKPSNIIIDKEGNARILDFGIARSLKGKGITGAGVMIGTPEYMSPEQVEGKEIDQRSDIYSLGVILYEMVTGSVPFEGDTPFTIGVKHKSEMPKDPKELNAQIPEDLRYLIIKCLEKAKEGRYQSAREVQSELGSIEKGIPTTDRVVPQKKPITSKEITVTFGLKKLIFPAVIFVVLVIIGVLIWQLLPKKETVPIHSGKPSIAVLPFEDLSPQKDQEYFCVGMTDDIISKLSRINELKVSSRTSVMRYKNTDKDIKEIGQELGVASILEGSIQKEKDRIRISTQLINVEDNFHFWSETYNRKLESVFDIQDDISNRIAQALKIQLTESDIEQLSKVPTDIIEAYEFYLKGRSLFYKYEMSNNAQAISMFKKALELDSLFSLAYAGLSLCYSQYKNSGWDGDEKWLILAEDVANKAIELDANSSEAHFALGYVYEQREAYEEMEREMRQVLKLNPNHAHAHDSLADIFHRTKGELEDALREYNLALMIDPFLRPSYWGTAAVKEKQGKYRDAKDILLRALELDGDHDISMTHLGRIYYLLGENERSVEMLKKATILNPSQIMSHVILGLTYALLNNYSDAHAEADFMANMTDIPKEENFSLLYLLGWIYLEQGKWQEALENFKPALRARNAIPREKEPKWTVTAEDIRYAIAETYLRQKNFKAAIQEFSSLADSPVGRGRGNIYKNIWTIRHYKLATAYEKINDLTNSKREYNIFLKLWKDADLGIVEVEDAKKRLAELQVP